MIENTLTLAVLSGGSQELASNLIDIAIALTLLLTCFLVALVLRIYAKSHWFTSWAFGSIVLPAIMLASELHQPTGWLGVALIVGGLASTAAAGLGVVVGWAILHRKKP